MLTRSDTQVSLENVLRYKSDEVVARIAEKMELTLVEAEILFEDTLTFLWLTQQSGGGNDPSPLHDEGWHIFLLFTREYAKFCQEMFGLFVHHTPRRRGDIESGPSSARKTIQAIRQHLDPALLSNNWGWAKEGAIVSEVDCSPDYDCNGDSQCT